jgi:hypothetical protein
LSGNEFYAVTVGHRHRAGHFGLLFLGLRRGVTVAPSVARLCKSLQFEGNDQSCDPGDRGDDVFTQWTSRSLTRGPELLRFPYAFEVLPKLANIQLILFRTRTNILYALKGKSWE